eukprot:COSAG04_NODE_525_length_13096_cov_16.943602_5_plen_358_part_00
MKRSHTGESNLLPHFSFISAGEGGGNSWLNGYSGPRPFNNWTRGVDSNGFPDSCPDDLFGPLSDYPDVSIPASSMGPNPTLPYLLQDNQDCNRTQSDVPVIVLEDDYIRAAITPQWGGKIWSMFDKKHKRQMVFNNPAHQPYTIGYLHAWTSGGAEWNWSPGYVGHSVFSESDTWAAKLETERGPVVRVWEYDRLNHTCVLPPPSLTLFLTMVHGCGCRTWQVDMMLAGGVLWAHPKITNPNSHDLPGYWWTCVAMRSTPKTRVLAAADLSEFPCTPWPYGAHLLPNVTFEGPQLPERSTAWAQDMSFIGNIPAAHDFFMHKAGIETHWPMPAKRGHQPSITLVADDGYSVIHGHPL